MSDVLPCRSPAEALLYLDLAGWPREGRTQHLEEAGGNWIAVHSITMGGVKHVLRFEAPEDPRPGSFGGPEPSKLIDAGQFVGHATTLAASMPLDPEDVDPAWRATGARRLELAARCVDEALKFIPADASRVPPEAFFSAQGRALRMAEPGRFERDRLEAVATAYREVAGKYGQTPEPALRPVIRPKDWEGAESSVVRRLLPIRGTPWVAYAWDPQPLRAYVSPEALAKWGMSADDLHDTALARIHRQPPPVRIADLGQPGAPLRVAVAEGEYASEQILDPDFVRSLAADLGVARQVLVAIPYRGVLLAADPKDAGALVVLATNLRANPRGEALTDEVFVAGDGLLEGRVLTR